MNRLKQLRGSKGMTRVELAELMNVTKLTVLNWEHGTHEIKEFRTKHSRKELEEDNFGWVFDCPGVEVKEVK